MTEVFAIGILCVFMFLWSAFSRQREKKRQKEIAHIGRELGLVFSEGESLRRNALRGDIRNIAVEFHEHLAASTPRIRGPATFPTASHKNVISLTNVWKEEPSKTVEPESMRETSFLDPDIREPRLAPLLRQYSNATYSFTGDNPSTLTVRFPSRLRPHDIKKAITDLVALFDKK